MRARWKELAERERAWKFFVSGLPSKVDVNLSPTCYCELYGALCLALCVVTYCLKSERAYYGTEYVTVRALFALSHQSSVDQTLTTALERQGNRGNCTLMRSGNTKIGD